MLIQLIQNQLVRLFSIYQLRYIKLFIYHHLLLFNYIIFNLYVLYLVEIVIKVNLINYYSFLFIVIYLY